VVEVDTLSRLSILGRRLVLDRVGKTSGVQMRWRSKNAFDSFFVEMSVGMKERGRAFVRVSCCQL
jgi:hypothetical protein